MSRTGTVLLVRSYPRLFHARRSYTFACSGIEGVIPVGTRLNLKVYDLVVSRAETGYGRACAELLADSLLARRSRRSARQGSYLPRRRRWSRAPTRFVRPAPGPLQLRRRRRRRRASGNRRQSRRHSLPRRHRADRNASRRVESAAPQPLPHRPSRPSSRSSRSGARSRRQRMCRLARSLPAKRRARPTTS